MEPLCPYPFLAFADADIRLHPLIVTLLHMKVNVPYLLVTLPSWVDAFSYFGICRNGVMGQRQVSVLLKMSQQEQSPSSSSSQSRFSGSIDGEYSVASEPLSPSDSSSAEEDVVSAAPSDGNYRRSQLINEILRIGAASDRGQAASKVEKERVMELVSELELLSKTGDVKKQKSATGTWELVYSSTQLFRSSPFFMAGRAVCKTEEQAQQYDWFCDMHRAALAISTIGKVRQVISSSRIVSEFEVKAGAVPFLNDFTPFSYSGGWPVAIEGAIVSSADIIDMQSDDTSSFAWEIFMDTVEIKGSNIPLLRQILDSGLKLSSRGLGNFLENNIDSYTNPRPIFKTTFIGDGVRVSRDQDGKIFVYTKVSESTEPKDYSTQSSDLGLTKLLEGFNDTFTKFYL